ncbi:MULTISPECIES: transporter [Cohnella]|uniref:transporter n=1 Tax=Cohnella TaxID=329857 RepID=UPI0009BB1524|nr:MULTISPECIES: transporter [Cohnella]MBN2982860.1 transporter [Cohnella algarum]
MAFMPPFGPQGTQQPPTAPPPLSAPPRPQQQASLLAVDPGAITGCLFRNTYIWPTSGPGFWFYPIFVGSTSVSGFRWTGWTWVFSGFDTRRIDSFSCF